MEYTDLENQAICIVKDILSSNEIDTTAIQTHKLSTSYIDIITSRRYAPFRMYIGKKKKTFGIGKPYISEEQYQKPIFNNVKDKDNWYQEFNLSDINDILNYSDLIISAYHESKKLETMIDEMSEIDLSEEVSTVPRFTPIKSKRKKGNSIIDNIDSYTVIDLETTSKYTSYAEIIELAAVRVRNSEIVDKYSTLIKPSAKVSSVITAITGITNEMLENTPKIEDKIQEYLDFIGDDIILGHNIASFDSTILYDLCEKLNLKTFNNDILDTLRYSNYCNIDVPNHKLRTISEYFGIEHDAHRALNDCIANFEVYEKLKEHFTGNIILTVSGESRKERTSIESLTVKPCYSDLNGKNIVLTGEFACGQRKDLKSYFEKSGASVKSGVSSKTDYLIIGAFGSPDWKFGDYGDKVAKAQELQLKGKPIEIIQEEEFFE